MSSWGLPLKFEIIKVLSITPFACDGLGALSALNIFNPNV